MAESKTPTVTTDRPSMGVVVPLANEQDTIVQFLDRLTAQLAPQDMVFCIFDMVSRDNTMAIVKQYAERDPRIRVVWDDDSCSPVDAYFRGYHEALQAGCDWILEMDAGLSHRPEEIPRFIDAMQRGADFAPGSRFMPGGQYHGQVRRLFLSKGGSMLANALLGLHLHDLTSGYKCYSRRALQHVVRRGVRSRAHTFQIEVRYMLREWPTIEVPISYSSPSHKVDAEIILDCFLNLLLLYQDSRRAKRRGVRPGHREALEVKVPPTAAVKPPPPATIAAPPDAGAGKNGKRAAPTNAQGPVATGHAKTRSGS